ncbi:MAG: hypothetical protein QT05_C0049G0061 [archaeon GW2011_AR13]|nr:MAG: hypothetical protein QT05_C0049G0061 [archaeon GW2011_AR13]
MKNKYELLAPVGDFPMLVTAVNAGADAVFFGLKEFSMRTSPKNFTLNDLKKINTICGKKVKKYLTLNTIIYDNELNKIEKIIQKIKGKIDAIICWDLSVIELCKKYKIPFHISTQASVANSKTAEFYKKLGAERIVLARELNLKQIKKISKIIDIECFAHKVEDIEGNQLKIQNNKIFSAKDLCTLPFIEEMKKAGIKSFKIEGRSRDPRYVDIVIRVYRKALDKKLTKEELEENLNELKKAYNRNFSSGFYIRPPTSDDFTKVEHSAATEKKHFVGKVTHYYPKINVATIKLVSNLKLNDKIIILGNTTGLIESKIEYLEHKKKSINTAEKGMEIGLKLPKGFSICSRTKLLITSFTNKVGSNSNFNRIIYTNISPRLTYCCKRNNVSRSI